jgi:hypothetical protein
LAERGLADEEQGDRVVGLVSAILAGGGFLYAATVGGDGHMTAALPGAVGLAGSVAGLAAAMMASARGKRRRAFVTEAEAGRVAGYRVESVPDGKVLVRVESAGEAYRGAERFEAVYELATDGAAKRALVAE